MNDYLKEITKGCSTYKYHDFPSIHAFIEYIEKKPTNYIWENRNLSSKSGSKSFTDTNSFEEAIKLLREGWTTKAEQITKTMKNLKVENKNTFKSNFNVVGGNCSVPRYLQGVPTNMIEQKRVQQKSKIITITKCTYYNCQYSSEQIYNNSIKVLQIIDILEKNGYRCNLNIMLGCDVNHTLNDTNPKDEFVMKVRIKNANERLNISKLAFPLIHPSMIRRLYFRSMEVSPIISNSGFISGYGGPLDNSHHDTHSTKKADRYNKYLEPNEIRLPLIIGNVEDYVRSFIEGTK